MDVSRIFCDKYFGKREELVREVIGKQLDQMETDFRQLDSPVMSRLMNANLTKPITTGELLSFEPTKRQKLLSAVLYNDALWRLQAARIMLSIGMLNVCYSNLRSCVDDFVGANVIENLDEEAISFLKMGQINPSKIEDFIPPEYNCNIKDIKSTLGKWGVHCSLDSAQLGLGFGPNTFAKMISETNIQKKEILHEEFKEAAEVCITAMGDVFLMFMFIMSKVTSYRAKS